MALKEVPHEEVGRYGVIAPTGPVDADGVVPIGDLVEKPPVDEAPSDLIIIGRYVLTPDVFDEIAAGRIGALGEIQLTDALRAQAAPLAVPRRRQPHRPLRHRHPARLPHRGDRARPARPGVRRRAAGVHRRPPAPIAVEPCVEPAHSCEPRRVSDRRSNRSHAVSAAVGTAADRR